MKDYVGRPGDTLFAVAQPATPVGSCSDPSVDRTINDLMPSIDERRNALRVVLGDSESWLRGIGALPGAFLPSLSGDPDRAADGIRQLRTRAASTLINIAMLGAFSSGKSFLLSGLQGGLELVKKPTADGRYDEKYIGILPSSPVPTTGCPARVVPVDRDSVPDASGTGFLRVRFADSDDWEEVGNSPAPSVVAAYAMHEADVADRLRNHRHRDVAEIEILLSDSKLPAKLYDLPGHGSPNAVHDAIVKQAMAEADCFLYVSHASRTLSEDDLELIRFLYEHCLLSKKRVVWVLTAIDSSMQLDHKDVPAWQATLARNNDYLREHFVLADGQPDRTFIGEGFIAVSPALEAHSVWWTRNGDEAASKRLAAEGRMYNLRETLGRYIEQDTGDQHLAQIAAEARMLLAPQVRELTDRLNTERLPIDELIEALRNQNERVVQLDDAVPRVRQELQTILGDRVGRSSRPFGSLAARFHAELDGPIRSTDIRKVSKANQIQVSKAQLLEEWMHGPSGPATLWKEQLEAFKEDIARLIQTYATERRVTVSTEDNQTIDVADLMIPTPDVKDTRTQDMVQRAATVVGITGPLAAGSAWLLGATAATFAPAALVAGLAALLYAGIQYRKGSATSLEVTQNEWIKALDSDVQAIKSQFELMTGMQGLAIIDKLEDQLSELRKEVKNSAEHVAERMARPDKQLLRAVIDQLEPVCTNGNELLQTLRAFAHTP